MLDPYLRPWIDPLLHYWGKRIAAYGISANSITLIGFACGWIAMLLIGFAHYNSALAFIGLNRLLDGLDGAVARHQGHSDFGGFLDIVCDFIIYAGIVFAFCFVNPNNAFFAAFLLFSFIGPMTAFLAYAIIAAKKQLITVLRGKKSFYHMGGLCEGTETIIFLVAICLLPHYFSYLCLCYGVLCWITTAGRVYNAWVDFL